MRLVSVCLLLLSGVLLLGCEAPGPGGPDDGRAAGDTATVSSGPVREAVGDLLLEYRHGSGLHLHAFGLPVLRGSSIAAVAPGWTDVYYYGRRNLTLLNRYTVEDYRGGRRITLHHRLAEEYKSPFRATETITLYPDNRCEIRLDFEFRSGEPALLEWRVGGFHPDLAAGSGFRVVDPGGERSGTVPFEAPGPGIGESTVARGFERLEIASRIGTIAVEANAGDDPILFDYRRNRFADEANPMFWLGYLERPIPHDTGTGYRLTLHLPREADPVAETEPHIRDRVPVVTVDTARRASEPRDFLIPEPKEFEPAGTAFPLSSGTVLYTGADPGRGIENAVAFLVRDLREFYGMEPAIVREDPPEELPVNAILLGEVSRFGLPAKALSRSGLDVPGHREGYALLVDEDRALLAGRTEAGVFHGVTSLLQLAVPGPEGIVLRGARIVDYPSLDFRGVHALTGRDAGGQIARAVRDLMARHKMNAFVWQCGYLIWDAAPEIAHPQFGMDKEDARRVIEAADEHFVDLIPLIPTLGHVRWMFTNDQNLDLAEDPETPHAYRVTNPRTYEFLFRILEEAVDFFEPRGFHIGHDEVDMWGRFPYRSADSGLGATELILKDTVRLNDWFREREIEVYLWGDMFLHRDEAADATFAPSLEEARLRRSLLPRDITVADWHYEPVPPEEYTSLAIWRDEGFRTIGASWFDPHNIRNLALAGIRKGAHGLLQTTWAGFQFDIDGNESQWHQYWAYLLAAHYAWSGDTRKPEELPFVPRDEFVDTWFRVPRAEESRGGFQLDLAAVFNRPLADPDGSGWLGYGSENDIRSLVEDGAPTGRTAFRLPADPEEPGALLMAGRFNPRGRFPEAVTLEFDPVAASQLHFLLTGSHRTAEGREVGGIEIVFSDGSSDVLPLRYGREIFSFDRDRIGRYARIAWEGESEAGTSVRLWDVVWNNPHPGEKVTAIRIHSLNTETSPVLLAITGVP